MTWLDEIKRQEKPIYRWFLNEDGSITKYVVWCYYIDTRFSRNTRYKYLNCVQGLEEKKKDKFFSNSVWSFDNDDEKVLKIMREGLEKRISDKYESLEKSIGDYYTMLNSNNPITEVEVNK